MDLDNFAEIILKQTNQLFKKACFATCSFKSRNFTFIAKNCLGNFKNSISNVKDQAKRKILKQEMLLIKRPRHYMNCTTRPFNLLNRLGNDNIGNNHTNLDAEMKSYLHFLKNYLFKS